MCLVFPSFSLKQLLYSIHDVGNFKAGEQGTILKIANEIEKECLIKLMKDVLRPYVPEFKREVVKNEESILFVVKNVLYVQN